MSLCSYTGFVWKHSEYLFYTFEDLLGNLNYAQVLFLNKIFEDNAVIGMPANNTDVGILRSFR